MSITRILYRGSLSGCNYACGYCPFAKTTNTRAELDRDRTQLNRFVGWVESQRDWGDFGIFFTPWGEAIIHRYYREAMVRLSHLPQISRVVIQTNLSGHLEDLATARTDRLAMWATFHPTETDIDRFLNRCATLDRLGIAHSVGVVGFREHFGVIEQLRSQLRKGVYLWINTPKSSGIEYTPEEEQFLQRIDPYFRWNIQRWPSRGKPCRTGWDSFAVDGEGEVRRCHFVEDRLGNLYHDNIWEKLARRSCPNLTCGCHIGYVHRDEFPLDRLYGANILERIPESWPAVDYSLTEPAVCSEPVGDAESD